LTPLLERFPNLIRQRIELIERKIATPQPGLLLNADPVKENQRDQRFSEKSAFPLLGLSRYRKSNNSTFAAL
jgi:hypothetical protein